MNIAFDAIALLGPMSKNRGIGNYVDSQIRAMLNRDRENHYFFFNVFDEANVFWKEEHRGQIKEDDFLYMKGRAIINSPAFIELYGKLIQRYIKKNGIDVFYFTSPFDGHLPPYKKEWFEGTAVVATVYDIIPYVMRDHYFPRKGEIDWYMDRIEMLRWANRLLVISQSVKDDLIKYLHFNPETIDVIWGASSDMFKQIKVSASDEKMIREKFHITGKFVMCTGGDDERKNIAGLIEAFSKLPKNLLDQFQLAIVCKLQAASVERYSHLAKELGIGDSVILTNFVSNDELVQLYNLADLVAFPSVYEGFGLPVVEAWACGTGVVTSNNSSLVQIAGDAAILVDPYSIDSIAEGLKKALEGDLTLLAKKGQERLRQFTWDLTADETIKSIERAYIKKDSAPTVKKQTQKQRIAFFTPLPPLQSGISDYSADIITALADSFDIDVFIDSGYEPTETYLDNVQIYSYKEYEKIRNRYCETIYQIGNSVFHVYMWKYIRRWGGLVVLHDYNLHGVVQSQTLFSTKSKKEYQEYLEEEVSKEECKKCLAVVDSKGNSWNALTPIRQSIELNSFLTNYANKLIVHSDEAKKKLLLKDISRNVRKIHSYAKIEPLADAAAAKKALGIAEDQVVIAAFGHVHETKRAIPILRAFSMLAEEQENVTLVFGGKLDDGLKEKFQATVAELNLEGKVKVTGYLNLDEFLRYMDATDICLNLRWPYNGETSGSLMRMLGKGKCIVVNDMGSFAEVPDGCIVKIPSVETMDEGEEIYRVYKALQNLCEHPEEREAVCSRARQFAEEELDIRIIARQYADFILQKSEKTVTEELIQSLQGEIARLRLSDHDVRQLAHTLAYIKNS